MPGRGAVDRIYTSQQFVWATPVKIEELKASLRATIRTQDLIAALPIYRLPQELVDMIAGHLFDMLYDKFLKQWTIMYNCTDWQRVGLVTLGTVCRRALQITSYVDIKGIVEHFLLQHSLCPEDIYNTPEEQMWLQQHLQDCAPCQALVDQRQQYMEHPVHRSALSGPFADSEDYEDLTVDLNNAYDNHPAAGALLTVFDGDPGNYHFVCESFKAEWQALIDSRHFFSPREVMTLTALGFSCEIRIETHGDRTSTSALLIAGNHHSEPRYFEYEELEHLDRKRSMFTTIVRAPSLLHDHKLSLARALKQLRLTPCSDVTRWDDDNTGTYVEWPQLVSLTDSSSSPS